MISCNSFCGELDNKWKIKLENANAKYSNYLLLENIPCENSYLRLKLKTDHLDTLIIHAVHADVYSQNIPHDGWATILIYDKNNNYILSHHHTGNFFKQEGD